MLAGDVLHFTHTHYAHALRGLNAWYTCIQIHADMYVFIGSSIHSQTEMQTPLHPNAHHRLLQLYPSLPFDCGSEAGKLPWDSHGKQVGKKQPEDCITQLINKLMRSHFDWKIVSRQNISQPFPPTPGESTPDIRLWKKKQASRD